jgi:ribose/xylose/arabinose/galactoside ABC-type transport system permease subunit
MYGGIEMASFIDVTKSKIIPFVQRHILEFVLFALFVFFAVMNKNFLTLKNAMTILRSCSMTGIIALGMTLVIISGELDLSVGSAVAFSGCLSAWLVQYMTKRGFPDVTAIIIAAVAVLALGYCIGVFTASMRNIFNVPSFITSLGLLTVLRGGAYLITTGFPITSFPQWFGYLGAGYIANIFPFQALILAVVFFILFIVLHYTEFGRSVYAVGGNVESARLSGVDVSKVRRITFGVTGFLAAFSGLMIAAQIMSGTPSVGTNGEMTALSSIIIGGASLSGGIGKITGTLIGILFLGILLNGMTILGTSSYWQLVVQGILVIVAVLLNMATQKRGSN